MTQPDEEAIYISANSSAKFTLLKKYAYQIKVLKECGTMWTNIKIVPDNNIYNILREKTDECHDENLGAYFQPIQHNNVKNLG